MLLIALHWLSKPWGNEERDREAVSFAVPNSGEVDEQQRSQVEQLVNQYAERIPIQKNLGKHSTQFNSVLKPETVGTSAFSSIAKTTGE